MNFTEPTLVKGNKSYFGLHEMDERTLVEELNKTIDLSEYAHGDILCSEKEPYRNEGVYVVIEYDGKKYLVSLSRIYDDYGHIPPAFDCSKKEYDFSNVVHNNVRWYRLISILDNPKILDCIKDKNVLKKILDKIKKIHKCVSGSWYFPLEVDSCRGDDIDYDSVFRVFTIRKESDNFEIISTTDGTDIKVEEKLSTFENSNYIINFIKRKGYEKLITEKVTKIDITEDKEKIEYCFNKEITFECGGHDYDSEEKLLYSDALELITQLIKEQRNKNVKIKISTCIESSISHYLQLFKSVKNVKLVYSRNILEN
jgi:hypothetical protein